ncbi:hypothetical protein FPSE5266_07844 [Fusarium pseudograminearum]|nr:hypothetical protein FPSE5266_07844 [Fusarium pseudograminearum]
MTVKLVIPRAHRVPPAIYVFIIFTFLFALLFSISWPATNLSSDDADRKFAFIVPATSPSPDLCKTITTALALGYPSPVIVNWGLNHRSISGWRGGHMLTKTPGIVKYLDTAMHPNAHPSEKLHEDDIVLVIDGYDVWFQLPAQILLERYHKINREANERLYRQWNRRGPMPMRQTILFGSGKCCYPGTVRAGTDMRCDQWPMSPLRTDLYGPDTEKNMTQNEKIRPKWINDGIMIGPAGDVRRYLRHAQEKMERGLGLGIHMYSSQATTGEVFIEQEILRQWQRETKTPTQNVLEVMNSNLEFHAGLDYGQLISVQTTKTRNRDKSEHGDFVRLGDQSDIDQHSEALGIIPSRIQGLPDDIKAARNPLSDMVGGANWTDMPLYANFYTESVPVMIHYNSLKDRRSSWWHKPWYYQHLRKLVKSGLELRHPDEPLVTLKLRNGRIRYWPLSAEEEDRYPRQFNGTADERLNKMRFNDICKHEKTAPHGPNQEWWEEVFRDTGGPWK